jgi:hypothetical protein
LRSITTRRRAYSPIQLARALFPGVLLWIAGLFHLFGRSTAQAFGVTGASRKLQGNGKRCRKANSECGCGSRQVGAPIL